MRKIEQYTVQEGKTPLSGPELSRRFLDIDGRLHLLEELKISWEQAVVEVQNHGLERINGVIEPLLDLANDLVVQIQQELASVQQEWDQTIAQEWQNILDGWAGVQGTLDGMQGTLDGMQSSLDTMSADITATNAAITSAIPAAPLPLMSWQTDPNQYTVLSQNAYNSSNLGKDLLYKYVFPPGTWTVMYTQVLIPFSGYDLRFCFSYRMDTSNAGDVRWSMYYRVISTNESYSERPNWASFAAFDDSVRSHHDTPSASLNERNLVSGAELVIPYTAYSAYETIQIALVRDGNSASDTHSGHAEVDDSIVLVPVTW